MQPRTLLVDDRAVSPVIGVILMVAITVVLAAVIGTFVLGIGTGTEAAPSATFEFEKFERTGGSNPDELLITHDGGDAIPNDELYVTAEGVLVQDDSGSPGPADKLSWADLGDGGDDVIATASVFVEPPNSDGELEDKVFHVVWIPESDGESHILATWSGDDA